MRRQINMVLAVMVLLLALSGCACAEEALRVTITSDRVAYDFEDTATLTIRVENPTKETVYNVDLGHFLPDGLEYVGDSRVKFGSIPAGESVIGQIQVQKRADALRVTVDADKDQYEEDEIAVLTITVDNPSMRAVEELDIRHLLPEGLVYADEAQSGLLGQAYIPAGGTAQFKVRVMKKPADLEVVIRADKHTYRMDEVAELTIQLRNRTTKTLRNVDISHLLPNGLVYPPGKGAHTFAHETIGPGETVEHVVYVKRMDELPATGDDSYSHVMIFGAAMTVSAAAVAYMSRKRRTKEG